MGFFIGLFVLVGVYVVYVTFAASASRDKYQWPFSRYSIWNMPIGSGAQYLPAGLKVPSEGSDQYGHWWSDSKVKADPEFIGVNPSDPLKLLNNGSTQVRVPANMSWNGEWNGCATFLGKDGLIYQGQPLVLAAGGNPSYQHIWSPLSLNGDGIQGCHGGSSLSGIGGTIRQSDVASSSPIQHALKFELYCHLYCYPGDIGKGGGRAYRWPATTSDSYAFDPNNHDAEGNDPGIYGGTLPDLQMGSLLALKPGTDLSFITSPLAKKIATALVNYGAYVSDDSYMNAYQFGVENGVSWPSDPAFHQEMMQIITQLQVVSNNASNAIGGGGNLLSCLAPPFSDGTVDGITANPNGSVQEPASCSPIASTPTPTASATPLPTVAPDTSAPTSPANVSVSLRYGTSATVSWSASSDNRAVTGYIIWRSVESGSWGKVGQVDARTLSYTDINLQSGKKYNYRVQAIDAAGNTSVNSRTVSVRAR